MNMRWKDLRPLLAPDDTVAGGGDPPATPPAGDPPKDPPAGDPPKDPPADPPKKPASILDKAKPGDPPADPPKDPPKDGEPPKWEAPKDLPDHLKADTAEEALAKVLKAYQGARAEISKGGAIKGTVPETADGYAIKSTGDDDAVAKEWASEASKPLVDAFQAAALEMKLPAEAFQDLMRRGLTKLQEAGIPVGMTDEEQLELSADLEHETLRKMVSDPREADVIVLTVDGYRQKLVDGGLINEDESEEFRVMCGSAASAMLFYKILTTKLGEKPLPLPDPNAPNATVEEAYNAKAEASKIKDPTERAAAIARADAMMVKAVGTEAAGSIRSNVL